jgi:hypothetical protein
VLAAIQASSIHINHGTRLLCAVSFLVPPFVIVSLSFNPPYSTTSATSHELAAV